MKTLIITISLILLVSIGASAQSIFLSGYARDSSTFDLLPYTTIHAPNSKQLAASNENGYFSLSIKPGDTIVFTRLGYKPVKVVPTATAWDMNVLLPEMIQYLGEVVVRDHYIIHGHEQIQKSLNESAKSVTGPVQNQNAAPQNANTMIQTVGAGLVINGALSKLLGTDREKRRMTSNKAELVRTQVYYEVIQSPQVKEYLVRQFAMSDDQFFKSLEKFKTTYPTAVYIVSREEIVRLMVESFASK